MLYDPLTTWRSDATHDADGALPERPTAPALILRRLSRYVALHDARARIAPLPPLLRDAVRQRDLLAAGVSPEAPSITLGARESRVAREVYRALMAGPRRDEPWLEQWLLHTVGYAAVADDDAVPFWLEVLAHRPTRDGYGVERRTYALSALAYLAARTSLPEAFSSLENAAGSERVDVRAAAAVYLVAAHRLAGRVPPLSAYERIAGLARDDRELSCRVVARRLLDAEGIARPDDDPGCSYVFHTRANGLEREITVRAAQTVAHLASALARAAGLDAWQPFRAFLSGEFRGGRYVLGDDAAPLFPLRDLGMLPGHSLWLEIGGRTAARFALALARVVPDADVAPSPPAEGEILVLETHVNGTRFHDAPAVYETLRVGDGLALRRDASNSYDDRAVEVRTRASAMLGFVPRTRNRVVAGLMDAGENLVARLEIVGSQRESPYLFVRIVANAARQR